MTEESKRDERPQKKTLPEASQEQSVADAEGLALFGGSDASVGGQAVEVVEAFARRSMRQLGAAHIGELFLEAKQFFSSARIARRHRTPRARIASF